MKLDPTAKRLIRQRRELLMKKWQLETNISAIEHALRIAGISIPDEKIHAARQSAPHPVLTFDQAFPRKKSGKFILGKSKGGDSNAHAERS